MNAERRLRELMQRAQAQQFQQQDYQTVKRMLQSLANFLTALKDENASFDCIRQQFLSAHRELLESPRNETDVPIGACSPGEPLWIESPPTDPGIPPEEARRYKADV